MANLAARLLRRVESLGLRVDELSSLREVVGLPSSRDITRRQWSSLELQLVSVEGRLRERLKQAADRYLPTVHQLASAQRLNTSLGEIELDLSRAFTFFDTYMDVLTQRHTPQLAALLAGCDVLALDAMRRPHPALQIVEAPLVFCDRGFGASIIRESVQLPDGTLNPMPLIQIPYSRLREKPNLTSILHEAGHQALTRLGLVRVLGDVLRAALRQRGAPQAIEELFGLWSFEIGPDYWTFLASGIAAAGGIRDILSLPPRHVLRISFTDPHPPPFLRVLLAFECCRQEWGRGPWDEWEEDWLRLYPVRGSSSSLLRKGRQFLPLVARTLRTTRLRVLGGRRLSDLFELSRLHPRDLDLAAARAQSGLLTFDRRTPCAHLAVFRLLKEHGRLSEEKLDTVMARWLVELGDGSRRNGVTTQRKREEHAQ